MKKLAVAALFFIFVLLGIISSTFIKWEMGEVDGIDDGAYHSSGAGTLENDVGSSAEGDSAGSGSFDGAFPSGHDSDDPKDGDNDCFDDVNGGNVNSDKNGSESNDFLEESGHPFSDDAVAASKFGGDERFRVSEYDGKVAVFREGEAEPMWVLSSSVLSLPDADRHLLKEGIEVAGSELDLLLSDFVG